MLEKNHHRFKMLDIIPEIKKESENFNPVEKYNERMLKVNTLGKPSEHFKTSDNYITAQVNIPNQKSNQIKPKINVEIINYPDNNKKEIINDQNEMKKFENVKSENINVDDHKAYQFYPLENFKLKSGSNDQKEPKTKQEPIKADVDKIDKIISEQVKPVKVETKETKEQGDNKKGTEIVSKITPINYEKKEAGNINLASPKLKDDVKTPLQIIKVENNNLKNEDKIAGRNDSSEKIIPKEDQLNRSNIISPDKHDLVAKYLKKVEQITTDLSHQKATEIKTVPLIPAETVPIIPAETVPIIPADKFNHNANGINLFENSTSDETISKQDHSKTAQANPSRKLDLDLHENSTHIVIPSQKADLKVNANSIAEAIPYEKVELKLNSTNAAKPFKSENVDINQNTDSTKDASISNKDFLKLNITTTAEASPSDKKVEKIYTTPNTEAAPSEKFDEHLNTLKQTEAIPPEKIEKINNSIKTTEIFSHENLVKPVDDSKTLETISITNIPTILIGPSVNAIEPLEKPKLENSNLNLNEQKPSFISNTDNKAEQQTFLRNVKHNIGNFLDHPVNSTHNAKNYLINPFNIIYKTLTKPNEKGI